VVAFLFAPQIKVFIGARQIHNRNIHLMHAFVGTKEIISLCLDYLKASKFCDKTKMLKGVHKCWYFENTNEFSFATYSQKNKTNNVISF
jgi:hypothetical protein